MVPFLFIPISIVIFALIMRVLAPEWCNRVFCLHYCCKITSATDSDGKDSPVSESSGHSMNERRLDVPSVKQIDLEGNNENLSDNTPARSESLKQFAAGKIAQVNGTGTHNDNDRNTLEPV